MSQTSSTSEYWDSAHADVRIGDVFEHVPLLSRSERPITVADEHGTVYLPATVDRALLVAMFYDEWWFAPLITRKHFSSSDLFAELTERAESGELRGLLVLPSPDLAEEPTLTVLIRPTVLAATLVEELDLPRVASLSSSGRADLDLALIRLLQSE